MCKSQKLKYKISNFYLIIFNVRSELLTHSLLQVDKLISHTSNYYDIWQKYIIRNYNYYTIRNYFVGVET